MKKQPEKKASPENIDTETSSNEKWDRAGTLKERYDIDPDDDAITMTNKFFGGMFDFSLTREQFQEQLEQISRQTSKDIVSLNSPIHHQLNIPIHLRKDGDDFIMNPDEIPNPVKFRITKKGLKKAKD
jgi:hypothetical protein